MTEPRLSGWGPVLRFPDLCTEEVSRGGVCQPCDKPAVAVRLDEGSPYPVCSYHARAPMVPLPVVLEHGTDHGPGCADFECTLREQIAQDVEAAVGALTDYIRLYVEQDAAVWAATPGEAARDILARVGRIIREGARDDSPR